MNFFARVFCILFAVLARDIEIRNAPENATENVYIRRAVEYIQNNYPNGIHVSDIAAYVGVSRGYLHTLFTKNIELSPQEYLINYRITKGKGAIVRYGTTNRRNRTVLRLYGHACVLQVIQE